VSHAESDLLERVRQYAMPGGSVSGQRFQFRQRGQIRMAPDKPWLDFEAEQWMNAAGLDFRWTARARIAGLVPVTVVDAFERGHGLLSVRVAGIVPVARARGSDVDRGEVMRALAEMPWRPSGFLQGRSPQLSWSAPAPIGSGPSLNTLRAGFDNGATRCHVDYEVDAEGRVLSSGAPDRPRSVGKTSVVTPWRGVFGDYKMFGGVRVPTRAEVAWLLPDAPFTYFHGTISDFHAIL
jgi:hypothetical protein